MPPAEFESTVPGSELSGMGCPTSSYATASRALRVILLNRPHNGNKIEITTFGGERKINKLG